MGRVQGKVVIVTGGASGVGKAATALLAQEGAHVVLTDLNEAGGRAVEREIGEKALFVRHDIASEDGWKAVMAAVEQRHGRLDALVNNAAIHPTATIEDETLEQWHKTLSINSDSVFLGCKYAIPLMKRSGGGSLVNVASTASQMGMPYAAYSASKGAVAALSRSIAQHCRNNSYRIRCNSVHPGGIVTPMTAYARTSLDDKAVSFDDNPRTGFAEPKDIATLILYLVSDESRYITGTELTIDNGLVNTMLF